MSKETSSCKYRIFLLCQVTYNVQWEDGIYSTYFFGGERECGGVYLIIIRPQEGLHRCMSPHLILGIQSIPGCSATPLVSVGPFRNLAPFLPSVTDLRPWESLQGYQRSHFPRYDPAISAPVLFPARWMWGPPQSGLPISTHLLLPLDLSSAWRRNPSVLSRSSQILVCIF